MVTVDSRMASSAHIAPKPTITRIRQPSAVIRRSQAGTSSLSRAIVAVSPRSPAESASTAIVASFVHASVPVNAEGNGSASVQAIAMMRCRRVSATAPHDPACGWLPGDEISRPASEAA